MGKDEERGTYRLYLGTAQKSSPARGLNPIEGTFCQERDENCEILTSTQQIFVVWLLA